MNVGCNNLRFSVQNFIEGATITATPASVTDINELKNSFSSRRAVWNGTGLAGEIVINAVLDDQRVCDCFAIPGHNLPAGSFVRIEFFTNATDTVPVIDTNYIDIADFGFIIPAGFIDPFPELTNPPHDTISYFLGEQLPIERIQVTANHPYDYTPTSFTTVTPPTVTTTTVSDNTYAQNAGGVLSLETGSGNVIASGQDTFATFADATASGGTAHRKTANIFYNNWVDAPRIRWEFTATRSGAHDYWVRIKTAPGQNSFYSVFDGVKSARITPFNFTNWTWFNAGRVTLQNGRRHIVQFAGRDFDMEVDKIVIQPAGMAAPAGTGPAESAFGTRTITTVTDGTTVTTLSADLTDSVQLRSMMLCNSFELENPLAYGGDISFVTDPQIAYTEDGKAIATRPQYLSRKFNLPLANKSPTDRLNLWRLEALRKPVLISAYPDAENLWYRDNYVFLGRFKTPLKYTDRDWRLHATSIEFVEV